MQDTSLSKRLYEETKSAHEQVESMPFVLALRNQTLLQSEYVQYLADLKVVYETLEDAMRDNLDTPSVKTLYDERLCRAKKLQNDLNAYQEECAPTQAAQDYARYLKDLSQKSPFLLLAHAYVRYLGDLSGGRMIKKLVEQLFPGKPVSFYNFDEVLGTNALGAQFIEYKNDWKKRLDNLSFSEDEKKALIKEAKKSFEFAKDMFAQTTT